MKPKAHPVRAKVFTAKDSPDLAATESNAGCFLQRVSQCWIGPDLVERCVVVRRSTAGKLHQLTAGLDLYLWRSATPSAVVERSRGGVLREPRAPLSHCPFTAADLSRNAGCRNSPCTEQDYQSSLDPAMSRYLAAGDPFQFISNGWGETNCRWFRTTRHACGRSRFSVEVQKISRIELQARSTS